MNNLVVSGSETLNITSSSDYQVTFKAGSKASLIVTLEGKQDLTYGLNVVVEADSKVNVLIINHNEGAVTSNESYELYHSAEATIAYMQLTSQNLKTTADYYLKQEGAQLKVQSASLTASKKSLNFNTYHQAMHTTANVDNLGVVLGNGECEMIIANRIGKGMHQCETHQTSRILTYDKTAKGKVLPILYIDDNDVKASHACSLGQPDESQIFYLTSRGLSRKEALQLITIGYLLPVTKVIEDEKLNELLKNEIEMKVAEGCIR